MPLNERKKVLVDGRVFSTGAFDRGMGRYVTHLLTLLDAEGHDVSVLLYQNMQLPKDSEVLRKFAVLNAEFDPARSHLSGVPGLEAEMHEASAFLSRTIEEGNFDVYVDATPFLAPLRLDIFSCAVVSICYDFIPLKHADFYLVADVSRSIFHNGLARVAKSDSVICISEATANETMLYLGVRSERLFVIYPDLDDYYLSGSARDQDHSARKHMFAIVGAHRSKNPVNSARIFHDLARLGNVDLIINAPKGDQKDQITGQFKLPKEAKITSDISEESKHQLQGTAAFVAHLSIEEGFGIPFLEALFLNTKVLALDIPINREITAKSGLPIDNNVFYIPADSEGLDIDAFQSFLNAPSAPGFFADIRGWFSRHWLDSRKIVTRSMECAEAHFEEWNQDVVAKVFSSIPGTVCGVADYTMAYVRSTPSNVVLFFSMGQPEQVSFLRNIKLVSHLDFERFSAGKFRAVKGIYNFAFSEALSPGIFLMKDFAKQGDTVLIHERYYFDAGLMPMLVANGRVDSFFSTSRGNGIDAETDIVRERSPAAANRSDWLRRLGVRLISHLPETVMEYMRVEQAKVAWSINDMEGIEDSIDYVPLGIDDRSHPAINRSARQLRIERGLTSDDLLIGHFGLIIDDLKRLGDAVNGFVAFASKLRQSDDKRKAVFALVGKIVDQGFFSSIKKKFEEHGLEHCLVHQMPMRELDFDAEIAACDAVFCMRRQQRGQVSHVFVRSLSLGVPVLINRDSGYGYDPMTTLNDDAIEKEAVDALQQFLDPEIRRQSRFRARLHYDSVHRGDQSLAQILKDRHVDPIQ